MGEYSLRESTADCLAELEGVRDWETSHEGGARIKPQGDGGRAVYGDNERDRERELVKVKNWLNFLIDWLID